MVTTGGDTGCPGTLGSACLVGTDGIDFSVGPAIGVSVCCYAKCYGSYCFGTVLVLNMSENCS